jgi:hypothetical protein
MCVIVSGCKQTIKGFVMTESKNEFLSETFVTLFSLPNCSICKYFELLDAFEYCHLHDTITEGKICNGFRIKITNA